MPETATQQQTMGDFLKAMVQRNASDLHLAVGSPPTFRVNGELAANGDEALSPEAIQELIFSILTTEQREQFQKQKELDFSYSIP